VKVIQDQGEINIGQLEGLIQRGIVSKYELILLTNKEVMANVKVFGCSRRSFRIQGKKIQISLKVLPKGLLCQNMSIIRILIWKL
jgi:hypothetical protein